jgi:hypothetical protein
MSHGVSCRKGWQTRKIALGGWKKVCFVLFFAPRKSGTQWFFEVGTPGLRLSRWQRFQTDFIDAQTNTRVSNLQVSLCPHVYAAVSFADS